MLGGSQRTGREQVPLAKVERAEDLVHCAARMALQKHPATISSRH
jgi:hypothetical protein